MNQPAIFQTEVFSVISLSLMKSQYCQFDSLLTIVFWRCIYHYTFILQKQKLTNIRQFSRRQMHLYYNRPYSSLFTQPSSIEIILAKQNKILNKQVDILLSQNRRLRTQIQGKDSHYNDNKILYSKDYTQKRLYSNSNNKIGRNKGQDYTKQVIHAKKEKEVGDLGLYTFHGNIRNKSIDATKKVDHDITTYRQKSAPKYHYHTSHNQTVQRNAKTLIEQLKFSDLKHNPENLYNPYSQINKNFRNYQNPKLVAKQNHNEYSENLRHRFQKQEVKHIDTSLRTNKVYLNEGNSDDKNVHTAGEKLKNIKHDRSSRQARQQSPILIIQEQKQQRKQGSASGKKKYLSLASRIFQQSADVNNNKQGEQAKGGAQ